MNKQTEAQPVSNVKWVGRDRLTANTWNPNHVARTERDLLILSIEEDGWTQPIVVQEVDDPEGGEPTFEIVDGYHRWQASNTARLRAITGGLVPIVVVALNEAHARMSTIRHNRARGQHTVPRMADIVQDLLDSGIVESQISVRLGMEAEEVRRLEQRGSVKERIGTDEMGTAWRSAPPVPKE